MTTKAGKKVTMLKATVERRYKDRDGQWKSSNSFSRNEMASLERIQRTAAEILEAVTDEGQDRTDGADEPAGTAVAA